MAADGTLTAYHISQSCLFPVKEDITFSFVDLSGSKQTIENVICVVSCDP